MHSASDPEFLNPVGQTELGLGQRSIHGIETIGAQVVVELSLETVEQAESQVY